MSPPRPRPRRSPRQAVWAEPVTEVRWPRFARARAQWRRPGGLGPKRLAIVGDWSPREVRTALALGVRGLVHESAPESILAAARAAVVAGGTFVWLPAVPPEPEVKRLGRPLTAAQLRIMKLVAEGLKSAEIAAQLGLSVRTVETHRHQILRRTGLAGGTPFLGLALALFPG